MCHYYAHIYTCKHTTHALAKYCTTANLVQTPCKKKQIWQTIRMGEDCEDCAMPAARTVAKTVAKTAVVVRKVATTQKTKRRR